MPDKIKKLIDVAAGKEKADLVLKNCNIVNVFTQEIVKGDIAIADGKIAGTGSYEGLEELDCDGFYAAPGLIDSHVHIESTMVSPLQFARVVVPRGTTTVIADPHEIANVCGMKGIQYMLDESEGLTLDVFIMLPSCVPATPFETSGARIEAEDMKVLMENRRIPGLGEMMNYEGVISAQKPILDKLCIAMDKVKDGHAPQITGKDLNAYAAAGIKTEHECTTVEDMFEKLKAGLYIQIREGSAAKDLKELIKGVNSSNMRRCIFCTDDRHLQDIINEGHIDNNIRLAVKSGVDPIGAVTMATLNAAECYGIKGLGAIAPGYKADIIIVDDLKKFNVTKVFKNGRLTAREGSLVKTLNRAPSAKLEGTIRLLKRNNDIFKIKMNSDTANVIRVKPGSLITEKVRRKVKLANTYFECSENPGIIKLAVLERHRGTGNIGLGLLENLQINNMAIASTVAHDSHNLIVAGDNDTDMCTAVEELNETGGGITICSNGKAVKTLPLPIAGLLSDMPYEYVNKELKQMLEIIYNMGVSRDIEPFMLLSFLALPVIPEIRLTDKGLFDITNYSFIDISC